MKKIWLAVLGIVLCGVAVLALIPRNKSEVSDDPYKFYYYPKLNTYYDFQKDNFVYTLDGGRNWRSKRPASAVLPEKLSDKILITAPVPDVWRFNGEHRAKYKGVQTDYIGRDVPANNSITRKTAMEESSASITSEDEPNITSSQEQKPTVPKPKRVQQIPEDEWEREMDQEANIWLKDRKRHARDEDYQEDEYEESESEY